MHRKIGVIPMRVNTSFLMDISNEPRAIHATCEGESFALDRGLTWKGRDIVVNIERRPSAMVVNITADTTALCQLDLVWNLVLPAEVRLLGDHWERAYGDLEWRGIAPDRAMPWYFLAESNGRTAGLGVKTGCAAFCSWQVSRDTLRCRIDVRNGGQGVLLAGRTLCACEIVAADSKANEGAFAFAQRFCGMLCDKPRMPAAPIYGGNSWYYVHAGITAERMVEDSVFLSSLAPDNANRPTVFLDDGWQLCRTREYNGGPWCLGNSRFPDMPQLAEAMVAAGVQPGIWLRPLLTHAYFPPEWRLPAARFPAGLRDSGCPGYLDPSIPEALAMIREDIARVVGWGFKAIKHDFSTFDLFGRWGFEMRGSPALPGWHFADRSRTSMEIVLALYQAIRETAGDALVLGCNTISHAAAGLFEMQRTGDDTNASDWSRTRRMGVNALAFRAPQHGTFYAADADCVGIVDDGIPWQLNAQWLELVSRSGTPLLVSVDPRKATPEQRRALTEAFARAAQPQPVAEPLDWMHSPCPAEFVLMGEKRRFRWDA